MNLRPDGPKPPALPTAPHPDMKFVEIAARFSYYERALLVYWNLTKMSSAERRFTEKSIDVVIGHAIIIKNTA